LFLYPVRRVACVAKGLTSPQRYTGFEIWLFRQDMGGVSQKRRPDQRYWDRASERGTWKRNQIQICSFYLLEWDIDKKNSIITLSLDKVWAVMLADGRHRLLMHRAG
jgi:hypothetical protein